MHRLQGIVAIARFVCHWALLLALDAALWAAAYALLRALLD